MEAILDITETTLESTRDVAKGHDRWTFREPISNEPDPIAEPVVVVGSGPVGLRAVQELLRRAPHRHIVWYGAESGDPYNRVQLSSLLAGEISMNDISGEYLAGSYGMVERRFGCPITQIDRKARLVVDERNRFQPYSTLIIATGSKPRIPKYVDPSLPGVFTFRNLEDAKALAERRGQSACTVVLGGGLLGLEAAKAMLCNDTKVVVIDRSDRLLGRQLDARASALLEEHMQALGIDILHDAEVEQVLGVGRVQAVQLADRVIHCDTLIVATGVTPNVELAQLAGLRVNRGIEIDDRTVTSDPNIHAIGECAEHRGTLYGLVAPGFDQARVAAANIAGTVAAYTGSVTATRLKVVGVPVFSIGTGLDADSSAGTRSWTYRNGDGSTRVRLVTKNGRVVGASAIGPGADISGLQKSVQDQVELRPAQLLNFKLTGRAWAKPAMLPVREWAADAIVCNCAGVTRGRLTDAYNQGCTTVASLACCTGASKMCGSCKPLLEQFVDGTPTVREPAKTTKPLVWSMAGAAMFLLAMLMPWSLPYASSATDPQFDFLWRDGFWRQVSGYTLLSLSVLAMLISARKRLPRFRLGDYGWWRVVHIGIGVLGLATMFAHTGGRLGSNLNLLLSVFFLAPVLIGLVAGSIVAREHKLGVDAVAMRRRWMWAHLVTFWPLPLLLAFHVVQVYAF